MNWNGVIGSVASVINTALPLFLGGARAAAVANSTATRIGPATLFEGGDVLKIGNFGTGDGQPNAPLLINFTSPEGDDQENLALHLGFGQAFAADTWLQKYTDGDTTIGVTQDVPSAAVAGGPVEALYTFVTSTVLGVANTITAVVNPSLSLVLKLRLEANNQVVAITALGVLGYLGGTYLANAVNNGGRSGTRSGTLEDDPSATASNSDEEANFIMPLPSGIDYSDGIYKLQLQLPINVEATGVASNPAVEIETISPETIASLRYV